LNHEIYARSVRDNFESKIPTLQSRLTTALDVENYTLDPNISLFYTQAHAKNYGDRIGRFALNYFEAGVTAVERLTNGGKDLEAAATFKKLVSKNIIRLASSGKVQYAGTTFKDGMMEIVYNPEWIGVNSKAAGDELVKEMDMSGCPTHVLREGQMLTH
jgi:hypothetical protein